MLVGEENQGWQLITTQLNHERVMLGPAGRLEGLRDRVAAWADRARRARRARRRAGLGEVTAASGSTSCSTGRSPAPPRRASSTSPTRRRPRCSPPTGCSASAASLAEVVHRYGDPADPETGELVDYLDAQAKRNLVLTFGGGVNEVQRELIAMFGLGLPRVPR